MPPKDDYVRLVPCGETLSDAVSTLIKELRRGKELEAVYWARQIEGAGMYKYVWRRLAIFAAEDVGLGNPDAIVQVQALKDAYMAARTESSKKSVDGNLIVLAVLILARSPKNRESDHLKNAVHVLTEKGWQPPIPEYAKDSHTRDGRARGLTKAEKDREWFMEASFCENEVGPYDARLWHLRRIAAQGSLPVDQVEEMARRWHEEGMLVYGLEGRFPIPAKVVAKEVAPDQSGQVRWILDDDNVARRIGDEVDDAEPG